MNKTTHINTVPMDETFGLLEKRLLEANFNIDATNLKEALDNVEGTAITIGCGGSLVVANYLSKVLAERKIFSVCRNARDIMHESGKADFLFAFSYSGKTHGIQLALDKFHGKKYLITCNSKIQEIPNENVILLGYENMEKEKSFISLSSTLIPMGEFLKAQEQIEKEIFATKVKLYLAECMEWSNHESIADTLELRSSEVFEIMSGSDTSTASSFLESTLVEAGLGIPIIHDKYSYCHGRSTLSYKNDGRHHLIYLINEKTELDEFLISIMEKKYHQVTIMDASKLNVSSLEKEYYLTLKCAFLCKKLAEIKKCDISQVEYDRDIVRKVYYYKGEM